MRKKLLTIVVSGVDFTRQTLPVAVNCIFRMLSLSAVRAVAIPDSHFFLMERVREACEWRHARRRGNRYWVRGYDLDRKFTALVVTNPFQRSIVLSVKYPADSYAPMSFSVVRKLFEHHGVAHKIADGPSVVDY